MNEGCGTYAAFPNTQRLHAPLVAHRIFKSMEPRIAQAPKPPIRRPVDVHLRANSFINQHVIYLFRHICTGAHAEMREVQGFLSFSHL